MRRENVTWVLLSIGLIFNNIGLASIIRDDNLAECSVILTQEELVYKEAPTFGLGETEADLFSIEEEEVPGGELPTRRIDDKWAFTIYWVGMGLITVGLITKIKIRNT